MLVVPALVAVAVALLPLGYLGVRVAEAGWPAVLEALWRERTLVLAARSLALAAAVTAAAVVIGVVLAWLTMRTDLPGRRAWAVVAALPLAMPSFVAAYAWVSVVPAVDGFLGTWLVLTLCTYPYVYLPVAAALRRTDPALEEVARSLGHGPARALVAVTGRLVRPAAAAGGLLVALYALSDFGTPSLMRYDVFTRVIHTSYSASFDRTPAAALSLVLVALTVAVTVAEVRSRGRAEYARVGGGAARRPRPVALGRATPAALAFAGGVAGLALAYPAGVLTLWVVRGRSAGVDWSELAPAGVSTVTVAALGALAATALAVPVGVLAARHPRRGGTLAEHATYAGHAIPGIVVALALVFFGVRYATPIYQEIPLLVLAYAVLFMPAAIGAVRTSVLQSSRRVEEVARSLGRSALGTLRDVTLPVAGPGIGAGFALVLLTAMKELPATLLLRPTGMETLATQLWSQTGIGAYAAAAPYAVALVLLAVVPTALLLAAQRSSREDDDADAAAEQQRFRDEVLVVPGGGTS